MQRAIQLQRYGVTNANHWHLRTFRLRIEVGQVEGDVDRHVFVYSRQPPDPYTGETTDIWQGVASPVDLVEYPAHEPSPEGDVKFFRKDHVEVDVRSTDYGQEIWDIVRREVATLIAALDRLDELELQEEVWVGKAPESPESPEANTD